MAHGFPDFAGDKWGLVSYPEWATIEGTDIDFWGRETDQPRLGLIVVAYVVPAGRTLKITQFGFQSYAQNAPDADNNQMCYGEIFDFTDFLSAWGQGGNGGGEAIFSKPIVIEGGHTVYFSCQNFANHNSGVTVYAGGYLV